MTGNDEDLVVERRHAGIESGVAHRRQFTPNVVFRIVGEYLLGGLDQIRRSTDVVKEILVQGFRTILQFTSNNLICLIYVNLPKTS